MYLINCCVCMGKNAYLLITSKLTCKMIRIILNKIDMRDYLMVFLLLYCKTYFVRTMHAKHTAHFKRVLKFTKKYTPLKLNFCCCLFVYCLCVSKKLANYKKMFQSSISNIKTLSIRPVN